jgi:hypothetical protein
VIITAKGNSLYEAYHSKGQKIHYSIIVQKNDEKAHIYFMLLTAFLHHVGLYAQLVDKTPAPIPNVPVQFMTPNPGKIHWLTV